MHILHVLVEYEKLGRVQNYDSYIDFSLSINRYQPSQPFLSGASVFFSKPRFVVDEFLREHNRKAKLLKNTKQKLVEPHCSLYHTEISLRVESNIVKK